MYWELEPWGDDWRQTSRILQLLFAQKNIKIDSDELIPRIRKPLPDPSDLAKKLWFGMKAVAMKFKKKA